MSEVSEISKSKYVAAILATVLMLVAGLAIGYFMASNTSSEFQDLRGDLERRLLSLELSNRIADQYICETNIFSLTQDKSELGRKLESLERKFGKDDPRIEDMKERYSLLSIRQLFLVKRYNKNCEEGYIPILYFYSNENNVTVNERQGYVLDYIHNRYKDRVIIYALSVDLDNPVLDTLKGAHEIKSTPSIVVNGTTYTGLRDREEMLRILRNQTRLNATI